MSMVFPRTARQYVPSNYVLKNDFLNKRILIIPGVIIFFSLVKIFSSSQFFFDFGFLRQFTFIPQFILILLSTLSYLTFLLPENRNFQRKSIITIIMYDFSLIQYLFILISITFPII